MNPWASATYLMTSERYIRIAKPAENYAVGSVVRIRTHDTINSEGATYRITGPMQHEVTESVDYRIFPAEQIFGEDIPYALRGKEFPRNFG